MSTGDTNVVAKGAEHQNDLNGLLSAPLSGLHGSRASGVAQMGGIA